MTYQKQAYQWTTISTLVALFATPILSIALAVSVPLCRGDQNADVSKLQQFLKEVGYFTYPTVTGYYGPYTQAAVTALQHSLGLPETGCLDAQTESYIDPFLAGTATTGLPMNNATTSNPMMFDYIGDWNEHAPDGYTPGYGEGGPPAQQQQQNNEDL